MVDSVALVVLTTLLGLAPPGLSGPATVDPLPRDAESIELQLSQDSDLPSVVLTATLLGCTLPGVSMLTNAVVDVTFDIAGCDDFAELGDDVSEVSLEVMSETDRYEVVIQLEDAAGEVPWTDALVGPLRWGLVAGGAALVLGGIYALIGKSMAEGDGLSKFPVKKVCPTGQRNWKLPAKPTAALDFGSSGVAGKLVFVGAAITSLLALTDLLDPILDDQEQLALAVTNISAVLVAGTGPLAVLVLQLRYRPVVNKGTDAKPDLWVAGDEVLVASVPGVVLGSALTAGAVGVQIAALAWAAEVAEVGSWTNPAAIALGIATTFYCAGVAGSLTVSGRRPPLVDDPNPPVQAEGTSPAPPSVVVLSVKTENFLP